MAESVKERINTVLTALNLTQFLLPTPPEKPEPLNKYISADKFNDKLKRNFHRLNTSEHFKIFIIKVSRSSNEFESIYKKAQYNKAIHDELYSAINIMSEYATNQKAILQQKQVFDQVSKLSDVYSSFEDDLLKTLNYKTFHKVFQHVAALEYRSVFDNKIPLDDQKFEFVLAEMTRYIEKGKFDYERNKERSEHKLATKIKVEKEKKEFIKMEKLTKEKRKAADQLRKLTSKYMILSISIKENKPPFMNYVYRFANEKFFNVIMSLENGKPITDRQLEESLDAIKSYIDDVIEKENKQKVDLFSKAKKVKKLKFKPRKPTRIRVLKDFDQNYLSNVKQHGKVERIKPNGPGQTLLGFIKAAGPDLELVNGSVGSAYYDSIGKDLVKRCVVKGPQAYNVGRLTASGPKVK